MSDQAAFYESGSNDAPHVGRITLNRPDNRNSMTAELLAAFEAAVDAAIADPALRALVVTGRGSCFSAGADFRSGVQVGEGLPHSRSYAMYRPFLKLLDVEVPVIGALNGHAVGGGFGLSLVCDLRIANGSAKYGANFTQLGLHSGMAISYLLPRLVGVARANELLFTGELIRGHRAQEIGLVNAAVPAEEVLPRALTMAEKVAAGAPLVMRSTKRAIYEGLAWNPRQAARHEAPLQAESLATADAKEGMAALLGKRKPNFRGA